MSPVKLPARSGWLCGTCARLHAGRNQAIDCCAESQEDCLTNGDYVLLTVALLAAALFLLALIVPGACETC